MKKVLFIGPYRQKDGWGRASRDYIKALATKTNIDLYTRPIYLAPGNIEKEFDDQKILEYEQKHSDSYDCVIQKVLPEYFHYDSRFGYNIGLFTLEINDFTGTNLVRNANRMDELWVPSSIEKQNLIKSGVIKPIRVISQPIDTSSFEQTYSANFNPIIKDYFKFYTICENNHRKNLEDLILSFNMAFNINDPVVLIIKTSGDQNQLDNFSESIKRKLHLGKPFKKELWVTHQMSNEEILAFHSGCDCFVMSSYGESFCRPAAEALCLGKNPIINKNTGTKDFINDDNGFLVKSHKVPVILDNHPIANNTDYYNANQFWYKIDIYDMIQKMQNAYSMYKKNNKEWQEKSKIGISAREQFSYTNIGEKLCIPASL